MNAFATPAAVATNPPRAAYRPPTREDILTQCIAADAQWAEKPGRNLVLVSHSGCMEQVEQQLQVATDADTNSYASALFITLGENGKPRVLGQMAASQWRKLANAREI